VSKQVARKRTVRLNNVLCWALPLLLLVALVALAACGTTSRDSSRFYQDDGPPKRVPAGVAQTPDAIPRVEPFYAGANRPYRALGRRFTPITEDAPFHEHGVASWYGRQFQGNRTAIGERYDMLAMTAAHPTMPLPSYARVTNRQTGARVVVRVNDRGPFKSDRVLDLSYAAAARLGIAAAGSGEVEIERITWREIDGSAPSAARAAAPTSRASLPPLPSFTTGSDAGPSRWSVQFGAFAQAANAAALCDRLSVLVAAGGSAFAASEGTPRVEAGDGLFRVLLGHYAQRGDAQRRSEQMQSFFGREAIVYLRP